MGAIEMADEAIALAALAKLYENYLADDEAETDFTEYVVRKASKVQFQPSTRQLVLKFDLSFKVNDAVGQQ